MEPGDFVSVGGHQIRLCVPGETNEQMHADCGQIDANEEFIVERTVVREQRVQVTTRVLRRRGAKSEHSAELENEIEAPILSRFETEPAQKISLATRTGIVAPEGQRQISQIGKIKLAQHVEEKAIPRLEFVEPNKKVTEQEIVEVGVKDARPINCAGHDYRQFG